MTLSRLHNALKARFPATRMPSRSQLARELTNLGIKTRGRVSRLSTRPEIGAWFLANTHIYTLNGLRAEAVRLFGASSVPSHTVVARFVKERSPIGRKIWSRWDREVEDWILGRLGSQTIDRIRAGAMERFGSARVPSRDAILRRLRRRSQSKF